MPLFMQYKSLQWVALDKSYITRKMKLHSHKKKTQQTNSFTLILNV